MRRTELPAEERIDGGGARAFPCSTPVMAGTAKLAGCDTTASVCK